MTWDLEKKRRKNPMYPVQYLRNNITTRIFGPGSTTKLVRTMAQDSVHKKKRKKRKKKKRSNKIKRAEYTLWVDPHTVKVKSSLKKKTNSHCHKKKIGKS